MAASPQGPRQDEIAREGRRIALVIAGAALLSIFAPQIAGALGLGAQGSVVLTLIALAAFIWCLFQTAKLWQKTRDKG